MTVLREFLKTTRCG